MAEPMASVDPAAEDLSFAALKQAGLALAQQLASAHWTDYNLHDPGVTLLEQFCYALTDLVYRSEFEVVDHLTGPDGRLDLEALGLQPPEEILPCHPTTLGDYRRVLIDRVADLEDAWLLPLAADLTAARPGGLYRLLLRPADDLDDSAWVDLSRRAAEVYRQHRNLGEDLAAIERVRERECSLGGEIEVRGGRDPAEILAEVHQRCAERIAARVPMQPLEVARHADLRLETIFNGPRLLHGYLPEASLPSVPDLCPLAELRERVQAVEGVAQINDLYLQVGERRERNALTVESADQAWRLRPPPAGDTGQVRLLRHGRAVPVSPSALQREREELHLRQARERPGLQRETKLTGVAAGVYRDLGAYTSIQTQLPRVYRVGVHGEEAGASVADRARSHQLKGYLLLFDQLMANFTADLAALRTLYSPDLGAGRSYAWQPLSGDEIRGLEVLYPADPQVVAEAVARHDNYPGRKGRVLDYLLALYGEDFRADAVLGCNPYVGEAEREQALLEAKAGYLRAVADLTRERSAAGGLDPDGRSGLERRVLARLGLAPRVAGTGLGGSLPEPPLGKPAPSGYIEAAERPATGQAVAQTADGAGWSAFELVLALGEALPFADQETLADILQTGQEIGNFVLRPGPDGFGWELDLVLATPDRWWRLGIWRERDQAIQIANLVRRLAQSLRDSDTAPLPPLETAPPQIIDPQRLRPPVAPWEAVIPLTGDGVGRRRAELLLAVGGCLPREEGRLSEAVLHAGILLDRYRLGHLDDQSWQLVLEPGDGVVWRLAACREREQAVRLANLIRRLFVCIHREGEGMYLVEHLLLRPRNTAASPTADPDFYEFQISAIWSGWSARCRQPAFRALARQQLAEQCPAHLVARLYWLELRDLREFERLYRAWVEAQADADAQPPRIDAAAAALTGFLNHHPAESAWGAGGA